MILTLSSSPYLAETGSSEGPTSAVSSSASVAACTSGSGTAALSAGADGSADDIGARGPGNVLPQASRFGDWAATGRDGDRRRSRRRVAPHN